MNKNFFTELKAVRRIHNREKGQGLTEFALTITIFLAVVIFIMEMGWLFYFYNSIIAASHEAARYGAAAGYSKTDTGVIVNFNEDCSGIRSAAKRVAWVANLRDWDIQIRILRGTDINSSYDDICTVAGPNAAGPTYDIKPISTNNRIYVKVTGTYNPLINLVLIPSINLVADSSSTVMTQIGVSDQ